MALRTDLNLIDYGLYDYQKPLYCTITNENKIINFKPFHCFVVGKEFTPTARTYKSIKINNNFKRIITDVIDEDYILKVHFLFIGKTKGFLNTNIKKFIAEIETSTIKFNNDDYYFDCIIKEYEQEFLNDELVQVIVTFDAQAFTKKEIIKIDKNNLYYFVNGAKKTPLNFKITAKRNLTLFSINEIIIKSLNVNETIYIDSFNRKIIKNGKNAIDDVTIFEFPESLGKTKIEISSNDADVELDYKARW